jgi:hypothetical protein
MNDWNPNWIAGLHSRNARERAATAREIFAAGHARAVEATRAWFQHEELRALLWEHRGDQPRVTVGVAVHPDTFAKIHRANGSPRLADVPPDQDASEFALPFPGDVALDILTSREPGGAGAIARFLAKQGEGIQQVEYRCSDVDQATTILREQFGVAAVYSETRPGADGTRVNFFLVAGPAGQRVLVELYEESYRIAC